MAEPVLSRVYPRTSDSPLPLDLTVVDHQPQDDGWELVTFQQPDGSRFSGHVKWFPPVPPPSEFVDKQE